MKGVFGLTNYTQLFMKLEWEYSKLYEEQNNAYIAFNFFITAWHLLEWVHHGNHHVDLRRHLKESYKALKICEHLAVGAKHFKASRASINSVSDSGEGGVWKKGTWKPGTWKEGTWKSWLQVDLTGDCADEFGNSIKVIDLADIVIGFWRKYIEEL